MIIAMIFFNLCPIEGLITRNILQIMSLASRGSFLIGGSVLLLFRYSPLSPLYEVERGDLIDIDSIMIIKMLLFRWFLVSVLRVGSDKSKF
jgi:hypothetical protein